MLSWAVLGHLGLSSGHLEAILGRLEAILGHPGPSWGHLGAILGPSWAVLGPPGAILKRLGSILGPAWAILRNKTASREPHVAKTMADNETFRFHGGLALTNLFSLHMRIGAYLGVLSGAKTGPQRSILIGLRHFFAQLWRSETTPRKSSFCIAKKWGWGT